MAIKINIGTLNDGSQQISLKSDFSELGLEKDLVKGPVDITLDLYKTIYQLDLKVKASGLLNLECDRCLDEFEKRFEAAFELIYVQKTSREDEINEDHIRSYNPNMKVVDITNDIKEEIILTVPMKKVPEEKPDGSCSWCGKTKEYWSSLIVDPETLDDF